ncbi:hypothetical protein C0J50_8395 [Silurus asotus]|uniref:Uncharacterized protein n=1 Tax=Silurus asotus TaxID=30991 RepID=A0AAD5B2Y9_SILAS|nr:hypothetical protein C0J50_8395 [Silurus asotus]
MSKRIITGISETGEGTGAFPFFSEPTSLIYMSTAQPVEDMDVDDPYSCFVAKSKIGIPETGEGTGTWPFSLSCMDPRQPGELMKVDDLYSCFVAESETGYRKLGYSWTKEEEEEKERRKTSTKTAGKAEVEEREKGITESGEDVGTRPFYSDTSSSSCMGPGQPVEDWEMEDLCSCSLAVPESGEAPINSEIVYS